MTTLTAILIEQYRETLEKADTFKNDDEYGPYYVIGMLKACVESAIREIERLSE